MSKRKNTLKDLDEFLKQQAATLVQPAKLNVVEKVVVAAPSSPKPEPEPAAESETVKPVHSKNENPSRNDLYDSIVRTIESFPATTPEDKVLINTALYLKYGDSWKEKIRGYWRSKR